MSFVWAAVLTTCCGGVCPDAVVIDQALDALGEFGLSDEDQRALRNIRNPEGRTQSVAARLALLRALKGQSGIYPFDGPLICDEEGAKPLCALACDTQGAPYLLESKTAISLAHCEAMAIAVCTQDGRIGVDIEPLDRHLSRPSEIAQRYFSPLERKMWQESGNDARAFLRLWTRKEALGKAKGLGLAYMDELDTGRAENASFSEIVLDGFVVTVCQMK